MKGMARERVGEGRAAVGSGERLAVHALED